MLSKRRFFLAFAFKFQASTLGKIEHLSIQMALLCEPLGLDLAPGKASWNPGKAQNVWPSQLTQNLTRLLYESFNMAWLLGPLCDVSVIFCLCMVHGFNSFNMFQLFQNDGRSAVLWWLGRCGFQLLQVT